MNYEEAKDLCRDHVCADCGAELVIAFLADHKTPEVKCGRDKSHAGYTIHQGPEQNIRRGILPLGAKEKERKDLEEALPLRELLLEHHLSHDLATGERLGPLFVSAIVAWAHKVGLHAYLGHVAVMYGLPYITIDGHWYRLRNMERKISIGTRPLSIKEREEYQIPERAYAWLAYAKENGREIAETGLGIVTQEEITAPSKRDPSKLMAPVAAAHPQRMAEKRAEWQLLRKLDPLEWEEGAKL